MKTGICFLYQPRRKSLDLKRWESTGNFFEYSVQPNPVLYKCIVRGSYTPRPTPRPPIIRLCYVMYSESLQVDLV